MASGLFTMCRSLSTYLPLRCCVWARSFFKILSYVSAAKSPKVGGPGTPQKDWSLVGLGSGEVGHAAAGPAGPPLKGGLLEPRSIAGSREGSRWLVPDLLEWKQTLFVLFLGGPSRKLIPFFLGGPPSKPVPLSPRRASTTPWPRCCSPR